MIFTSAFRSATEEGRRIDSGVGGGGGVSVSAIGMRAGDFTAFGFAGPTTIFSGVVEPIETSVATDVVEVRELKLEKTSGGKENPETTESVEEAVEGGRGAFCWLGKSVEKTSTRVATKRAAIIPRTVSRWSTSIRYTKNGILALTLIAPKRRAKAGLV